MEPMLGQANAKGDRRTQGVTIQLQSQVCRRLELDLLHWQDLHVAPRYMLAEGQVASEGQSLHPALSMKENQVQLVVVESGGRSETKSAPVVREIADSEEGSLLRLAIGDQLEIGIVVLAPLSQTGQNDVHIKFPAVCMVLEFLS